MATAEPVGVATLLDMACAGSDMMAEEPGCQVKCTAADACGNVHSLCSALRGCTLVQLNRRHTWATLKTNSSIFAIAPAERERARERKRRERRREQQSEQPGAWLQRASRAATGYRRQRPVPHDSSTAARPELVRQCSRRPSNRTRAAAAAADQEAGALFHELDASQRTAPCGLTDVHGLHYWGLFSALNQAVRAIIRSFARGRRACFQVPPEWAYRPRAGVICPPRPGAPSDSATAFDCYFHSSLSCERSCRERDGNQPDAEFSVGAELHNLSARYPALDAALIRSTVTRWLFRLSPAARAFAERRDAATARESSYVAAHVRWGDKRRESPLVSLSSYLAAAAQLAPASTAPLLLFSTSGARVLRQLPAAAASAGVDVGRTIVPRHLRHADAQLTWMVASANGTVDAQRNALDVLADMLAMARGAGAVVTYSSNMGRFLYYLALPRVRDGTFAICSLDEGGKEPLPHAEGTDTRSFTYTSFMRRVGSEAYAEIRQRRSLESYRKQQQLVAGRGRRESDVRRAHIAGAAARGSSGIRGPGVRVTRYARGRSSAAKPIGRATDVQSTVTTLTTATRRPY